MKISFKLPFFLAVRMIMCTRRVFMHCSVYAEGHTGPVQLLPHEVVCATFAKVTCMAEVQKTGR